MASKAILAIALILVIGVVIVLALGVIPSSAVSGGSPVVVCTLRLQASGVYNDNGITHWLSNFAVSYSATGCHTQTLLELVSPPSFNIWPFSFTLTATLVDSQGINHCTCQMGVNIPALNTAYSFSTSTDAANVPLGTYTLEVTSPFPFGSAQGSTTWSETIMVSQS
jgi:hypothetical protein